MTISKPHPILTCDVPVADVTRRGGGGGVLTYIFSTGMCRGKDPHLCLCPFLFRHSACCTYMCRGNYPNLCFDPFLFPKTPPPPLFCIWTCKNIPPPPFWGYQLPDHIVTKWVVLCTILPPLPALRNLPFELVGVHYMYAIGTVIPPAISIPLRVKSYRLYQYCDIYYVN